METISQCLVFNAQATILLDQQRYIDRFLSVKTEKLIQDSAVKALQGLEFFITFLICGGTVTPKHLIESILQVAPEFAVAI